MLSSFSLDVEPVIDKIGRNGIFGSCQRHKPKVPLHPKLLFIMHQTLLLYLTLTRLPTDECITKTFWDEQLFSKLYLRSQGCLYLIQSECFAKRRQGKISQQFVIGRFDNIDSFVIISSICKVVVNAEIRITILIQSYSLVR